MVLMVLVSAVVTFSGLGQPHTNYVASVERVPAKTCEIAKKNLAVQHIVVDCLRESK